MQASVICVLLFILHLGQSSRILAAFPHNGKSHFSVFEPYLQQLAARGHRLLVLSHFPREKPLHNYEDIDLRGILQTNRTNNILAFQDITYGGQVRSAFRISMWGSESCEKTLQHPAVQDVISSNQTFDLLLAEPFCTDCFLAFAHKFKIPIVGFSSCSFWPWVPGRVGNPDNPSYVPMQFATSSDRMNFRERFWNTLWYLFHRLHHPVLYDAPHYKIARKYFGESLPPLSELAMNTSLILVNDHFSLNRPRPLVPGVVQVGGIHIRPKKDLSQDIDDFLNGAEHGAIYFCMGSMIRAETLPADKRDAFLQAFAELPQRVLWKWENDSLPGRPHNVKIAKWLPQFDVLNHPNIRVFMSHGGLLGTIEAVHVGVPMVGIPMYGDQNLNIKMVETAGMGVMLHYSDITKDNVLKALKTILDNSSYMENAKRTSRIFRDRPMSPMDTAIYWTEYVIRHRGAPHLRTAGADLPLYQYLLLDVIAVLLAGVLAVLFIIYFILKKFVAFVRGGAKTTSKSKKQQ
ncbi:UDP-glycosyltransferase UGT5-like isoform X4 [Periplaneta americana]|uniref:UDP-glycosyltransferase UGT5-like isoform X4 n=1 Tax=Periplaneta americana TaxID=6978 RepID=UPI0037E70225